MLLLVLEDPATPTQLRRKQTAGAPALLLCTHVGHRLWAKQHGIAMPQTVTHTPLKSGLTRAGQPMRALSGEALCPRVYVCVCVCVQVDDATQTSANGPATKQCDCAEGFGDFGCNQELPTIPTNASSGAGRFEELDVNVAENEWTYYQIKVCAEAAWAAHNCACTAFTDPGASFAQGWVLRNLCSSGCEHTHTYTHAAAQTHMHPHTLQCPHAPTRVHTQVPDFSQSNSRSLLQARQQLLLVELERHPTEPKGGRPVLAVKPTNTEDRGVPL